MRSAGSLTTFPPTNVVGEPEGRDSAPAIGLMAAILEKTLGEDAIMVTLPADHVIPNDAHFRDILSAAAEVAGEGWLVTLGIPPTGPDTGFGYIQSGDVCPRCRPWRGRARTTPSSSSRKSPLREVAEGYLSATAATTGTPGCSSSASRPCAACTRPTCRSMEDGFAQIVACAGHAMAWTRRCAKSSPPCPKISVDYGIAEKADKVAVIPADIGWNDVGSWQRLAEVLEAAGVGGENVVIGHHLGVDTKGALIYSPDRLIATIGMEDIIVIDTPDATLICPRSRSEDVKKVVEELKAQGRHNLL